jgi:hypothetical protein
VLSSRSKICFYFDNVIQICDLTSEFSWAIRAFRSDRQLSDSAGERVAAPFSPVGLQNTTVIISLKMPSKRKTKKK